MPGAPLFARQQTTAASKAVRGRRLGLETLEKRLVLDAGLTISEFMAVNDTTLADGDGNYEDWIEIYNPSKGSVNLDGWYLTDDTSNLTQWRFPAEDIDAGEYLVVFASGQTVDDYVDGQGNLHTNFRLASGGESVALVEPDGATVSHALIDYPEQLADVSFGITGFFTEQESLVSEGDAVRFYVPTAGEDPLDWTATGYNDAGWDDSVTVDAAGVLITEIGTGDVKLVEIENVSDQSIDTTGWKVLVNDATGGINAVNNTAWSLPASIAAGSVLYRTDDSGDNYFNDTIDWDAEGPGWAMVIDDAGDVMDFVAWGYTSAQIATLEVDFGAFADITVAGQFSGDGAEVGTTGGGAPTGGFEAFNDHVPDYGGGTHANTTAYSANATNSGLLKDISTGADTDVTVTVTSAGVGYASAQGHPAAGTDAYNIFNG